MNPGRGGLAASRRAVLAGLGLALTVAPAGAVAQSGPGAQVRLSQIEKRCGGRLGVAVFDATDETRIGYRAEERFPLCSTFKFLAVAAVLAQSDEQPDFLGRRLSYSASDLENYSPVTKGHVGDGMTIAQLCAAAIELSDNTAANLLLKTIDGPPGLTRYVRSLGDEVTRLDRTEPELNEAVPGDERDTTSPAAMLEDMRRILLGNALSDGPRRQLEEWLVASRTGAARLRAGVPSDWRTGDKTGGGGHGTANDIAIFWPPGRAPILAAVYLTQAASRLRTGTPPSPMSDALSPPPVDAIRPSALPRGGRSDRGNKSRARRDDG